MSDIDKKGILKWLYPGLAVKRWLLLALAGLAVFALGAWTLINNQRAREGVVAFVNFCERVFPQLTYSQGVLCFITGLVLAAFGIIRFFKQYLAASYPSSKKRPYYRWQALQQGPKIVVLGGGTGLSVLLRGLKEYTSNITAGVTVGDDGGSSGRLREQYGVVPVGDIRNCIVALADEEDMMEQLFSYRFTYGKELDGHSLGNLLLVAMSALKGNFQDAVADIDHILHLRGRVLPIAVEPITLKAKLVSGAEIVGESNISMAWEPICQLEICPPQVAALQDALDAIDEADVIILGPGSLYTSIIPNLLVSGVTEHIRSSKGPVLYICNVMTQGGETSGYQAEDHLAALLTHSYPDMVDYIVVNDQENIDREMLDKYALEGAELVRYDEQRLRAMGAQTLAGDLLDTTQALRHDPHKLAKVIMSAVYNDPSVRSKRGWYRSFMDSARLKALR